METQTVTTIEDMCHNALSAIALNYVGIKEQGGNNMGQMVERFQRAVDGKAVGEPWCLSFIWYCIFETERIIESIISQELQNKTKLLMTEHVQTMWRKSPDCQRVMEPHKGCLVLWRYHNSRGEPTSSGHIGICTEVSNMDKSVIKTVEANTSEGAVSLRTRNLKYRYGRMMPLGMLSVW